MRPENLLWPLADVGAEICRSQTYESWVSFVSLGAPDLSAGACCSVDVCLRTSQAKRRGRHDQRRPLHWGSKASRKRSVVHGDGLRVRQYWAGLESSSVGAKHGHLS